MAEGETHGQAYEETQGETMAKPRRGWHRAALFCNRQNE